MIKNITSFQNPLVKHLIALSEKAKLRKQTGTFIIEGIREIKLAVEGGFNIQQLILCEGKFNKATLNEITGINSGGVEIFEISKEIYARLAYRDHTEGLLAIAEMKNHDLKNLELQNKNPLILVAESPEKPGNIGALLRTADAAGLDAVIIANPHTDLYNPNIVRSSVGTLFTVPIAVGSTSEVISWLLKQNIEIFKAHLDASVSYTDCNYDIPAAIIVGTESSGLSSEWYGVGKNIIIPMFGKVDSMNVSVSAAVLIFEAVRQRTKNNSHLPEKTAVA